MSNQGFNTILLKSLRDLALKPINRQEIIISEFLQNIGKIWDSTSSSPNKYYFHLLFTMR